MHPGAPPPPPGGYGYPPGQPPGYPPGAPPPPAGYYGYPPGYGYPPPGPQRPSSPKTLGVLSIVFGSIIAFFSLIGLATNGGSLMRPNGISSSAWRHYMDQVGSVSMAMGAFMLVMSIALIVIGTGQRRYQRWAVSASVWWSLIALVFLVVQLIVNITVVAPALDRVFEDLPRHARETAGTFGKMSLFLSLVFYAPYPIIQLVTFRKREVVAAMDQPPQAP